MLLNHLICGSLIALAAMLLPTPAPAEFYADEWGGISWRASDQYNTVGLSGGAVGYGGLAPHYGYAGRYEYPQEFGGPLGYAGGFTAPHGNFYSNPHGYAGAYSTSGYGSHTFTYSSNDNLGDLREQFEDWFDD